MLNKQEIVPILQCFGLSFSEVTESYDTSHGESDIRWNYVLDRQYVLKINSVHAMWEERLQEISRLIRRYNAIGVYCPRLIPTLAGPLSCRWDLEGKPHICFVEEFARYPIYDWNTDHDRGAVVEHLGLLAARYTGVDLSDTRSMWSIIDLAPLDVDIDEKQENTNTLVEALKKNGFPELGDRVDRLNDEMRAGILPKFRELPRCVFQGDLNSTNELHDNGRFVGLIDFNLSGTDVNINVFVNETNAFPETEDFDRLSIPELLEKMDSEQEKLLALIFRHYALNETEKAVLPYYKRITDLFQYPNVCLMAQWLGDGTRREKTAALIQALCEKPL